MSRTVWANGLAKASSGNSSAPLACGLTSPTLESNSGQDITAFTDYDGATDLMQLCWSTDGLRPVNAGLSYTLDLACLFGTDPVYV
jgi:hypothetical protein